MLLIPLDTLGTCNFSHICYRLSVLEQSNTYHAKPEHRVLLLLLRLTKRELEPILIFEILPLAFAIKY